jgi:hypothetical protein
MPTALKDIDLSDISLPEFDRPSVDLKDVKLPKVDLSQIEMPDVGKAVKDAAVSVGLVKQSRSRLPFVIGAGVALAVAGFILMNTSTVRDRVSAAATRASKWVGDMRGGDRDRPVAFTAAETAPITAETTAWGEESSMTTDYPEGFGAEDAPTSEEMATNGRATPAVPR